MRHWLAIALLALPLTAAPKKPAKKESSASVAKLLVEMEQEWSRAGSTKDAGAMDRIIADDWISVDFQGKTVNKAKAIADLKSAAPSPPVELGDMKVRVIGATAIVTGKDTTGKFAWMDVFMKRDGHWQAVASQSTRIDK